MDRRTLIHLMGATAVSGLAGCSTGDDGNGGGSTPAQSPTKTPTATSTATPTETPMTTETDTTPPANGPEDRGLVTVTADGSVDETVERITADIEDSPLNLMTTVDHAGNAASVDRDLPPTTLLFFGNPNVGTPLMQASRTVALDLPQRMLVWEDDGEVKVTYNDPEYLARRHGIDGQTERLEQIRTVLDGLATGNL